MLNLSVYPILGPSVHLSQVIFVINVAGVIGSAVAAGILINIFS